MSHHCPFELLVFFSEKVSKKLQFESYTILQLAISPQQQSALEPVLVQSDTHLTLKVEGVIQHGSQPGLFRKIHSISISVDSAVVTKAQTSDQKVCRNLF